MIIELKQFLNKVVTIKTLTGLEIIGKFIGTNDDNNLIVLTHPRMVVLGNAGDNENNSITLYWGEGLEKILKLKNKKDLAIEFVEEISNIYN